MASYWWTFFARGEEKKKGEILKNTQAITTEILYFLEVVTSVILYKSPKAQRNYGTDQKGRSDLC